MISGRHDIIGYRVGSESAKTMGAADWLSLAAAPTFAIMALLTYVFGGMAAGAICSAMENAPLLSGMALMYLLMSIFHLPPWLRLVARRRCGVGD